MYQQLEKCFYLHLLIIVLFLLLITVQHGQQQSIVDSRSFDDDYQRYDLTVGKETFKNMYRKVNRSVANENLKVWVATYDYREPEDIKFELQKNTHDNIGDFTFYQDPQSLSAVTHFSKYDKMLGVFEDKYIIDVPKSQRHWFVASTQDRVTYPGDPKYSILTGDPSASGSAFQSVISWIKGIFPSGRHRRHRRNSLPDIFYPEVLVVIGYDYYQSLPETDKLRRLDSAVMDTIAYFNAIDMLYTLIGKPKVEFNIAGIIVEVEPNVLPLVSTYGIKHARTPTRRVDDAVKTILSTGRLFYKIQDQFPRSSYDYILYRIDSALYVSLVKSFAMGLASNDQVYLNNTYNEDTRKMILPIALIDNHQNMRSYSVAAHELAHLMQVGHDPADHHDHDDQGIMRVDNSACQKCIRWSHSSKKQLNDYFESREHCYLINKPSSLASGPTASLVADDMCSCFGYLGAESDHNQDLSTICSKTVRCSSNSEIKGITNNLMPKTLDGTVCGPQRVCWKGSCVPASTK